MQVQTQPGLEVRPDTQELTTTVAGNGTQKYDLDAAKYIVKGFISHLTEIRVDGLHIKKGCIENDPSQDVFQWTPACDMDWPGSPDPLKAPSLPIEFSANELAAFMLSGPGALVAINYGGWEHGPDEGMLEAMGLQAREPRRALRAAYAAYRDAEKVVGRLDEELQQQAQELQGSLDQANGEANDLNRVFENGTSEAERSARRDVARPSVSAIAAKADEVTTRAKNAFAAWRKAMVHQLLRPVATTPDLGTRTTPTDRNDVDSEHEWAAFQKHQWLWRAVRLDQSRVTAEIEKRRSPRPVKLTEIAIQDEMLAALGAELSQIHQRLAALGSRMKFDAQHAAEASFTIEEMSASRPGHDPLNADDAVRRAAEIRSANKEIDALIEAMQTHAPTLNTAMPAPVVSASVEPAKSNRTKRRTWLDDATETYLVNTFKAEQYPTVKDFYRILERKAGADSPFDKGTGQNSGSLFARAACEKVTFKMIETFVTDIRKSL